MEFADRLAQAVGAPPADAKAVADEHEWWSWGRIRTLMSTITAFLDAERSRKGDRVGLVPRNRPEHVAATLAVLASGRCLTVLGGIQPPSSLVDQLTAGAPAIVIGAPDVLREPLVRKGLTAVGVSGGQLTTNGLIASPLGTDIASRVAERGRSAAPAADSQRRTAIEISSSGTTGTPRTVALSPRQIEASLRASGQYRAISRRSTTTVIAHPIEHIAGLWALLGAVLSGRSLVLLPRFEVASWVDAVDTYAIRGAFLVPTALRDILDAQIPPRRLRSLGMLGTGASHCPTEVIDEFWRRYRIPVLTTYGATEFAGAIAGWTRDLHDHWWHLKAGSAGRPYSGVALRVVDRADGHPLPDGETGQLEVRSDQAESGATWTRTTDLARIDTDGFLWISGRTNTLIDRGGFKVSPERIEWILRDYPGVRDSAVVGIPDSRLGAVPVAAVEPEQGATRVTEQALLDHCRSRLAPYETPTRIEVCELPRTSSSKINRTAVEQLLRTR